MKDSGELKLTEVISINIENLEDSARSKAESKVSSKDAATKIKTPISESRQAFFFEKQDYLSVQNTI